MFKVRAYVGGNRETYEVGGSTPEGVGRDIAMAGNTFPFRWAGALRLKPRAALVCVAAVAGFGGGCALASPLADWGRGLLEMIHIPGINLDPAAKQVRIQQQFSIRIGPGAPGMPPNVLFEMEQIERRTTTTRLEERPYGRCLPVAGIAAVQNAQGNRLLLILRDSRVLTAGLEKACRAHDFYSGFYVERNADGQLCVERDQIHARSGANCRISDLKALVEVPSKR